MKIKSIFILFFLLSSHQAFANDDGFYTTFSVSSVDSFSTNMHKGYALKSGVGQKYGDFFRGEFNIGYMPLKLEQNKSMTKAEFPAWTVFGMGYFDLFSVKGITPYIGGGAGVAKNHIKHAYVDGVRVLGEKRFNLAWKAVGGVGIDLPKNLTLDIAYAYTDLGRVSTKDCGVIAPVRQDVKVREIMVGLRYNF